MSSFNGLIERAKETYHGSGSSGYEGQSRSGSGATYGFDGLIERAEAKNKFRDLERFLWDAKNFSRVVDSDIYGPNQFNAADYFEERKRQADDLKQRAATMALFMEDNMDYFNPDYYESMMNTLATFDTEVDDVMTRYQPSLDAKAGMRAYEDELRAVMERNEQMRQVYGIADMYSDRPVGPVYDVMQLFRGDFANENDRAVTDDWSAEQKYRLGQMQMENPEDAKNYAREVNKGQDPFLIFAQQEQEKAARLAMDLEAEQREIDRLQAELDNYSWNTDFDATSASERKAVAAEIQRREKELTDKRIRYDQAKREQDSVRFASVTGNDDFADNSGYVKTGEIPTYIEDADPDDLVYEYINDPQIRSQINQQTTDLAAKGYDLLSPEETGIYNYYYATEGPVKAQQYLDNIQETLTNRMGKRMEESKDTLLEKYGVAAHSGLNSAMTGFRDLFNAEGEYRAPSAVDVASGLVREDLAETGPKLPEFLGGASLGQVGYDVIHTGANMVPSILLSSAATAIMPGVGASIGTIPRLAGAGSAIGAAAPKIGAAVGSAFMGASAAGNAYQEALNSGYTKEQARAYSTMVGASEAGLEYLLGGISKLGGEIPQAVLKDILNGVDNAMARVAIQIGGSMASEGFEEGLQEVITPWIKNLTLMADEDVNWNEVAYSRLLGALTGGVMEGPSVAINENRITRIDDQLKKLGATGNTRQLAELIVRHRSGDNLTENEFIKLATNAQAMQIIEGMRGKPDTDAPAANMTTKQAESERPKVSTDGRAIQISTNTAIDTLDFAEVKDGKATIQLKDGGTVDYQDVNFASEKEANQFYAVESLPAIDTENANNLLHTIQDADVGKDTMEVVAIREAYRLGYMGAKESDLRSSDARILDTKLQDAIYAIGKQQRSDNAMVREAAKAVNVKPSEGYKRVVFEGRMPKLNKKQASEVAFVDYIADNFSGNSVHVFTSYSKGGVRYYRDSKGIERKAPNGKYVNGEIWLDLKSGDKGEGMMLNTFAHEMYHHIEKFNKPKAQELAEFVVKELGLKSVDNAVQAQIRKARAAGYGESYFKTKKGMTDEQARNEVYMRAMSDFVADSLETMFTRGDPAKAIANLKKENRSLFDEIKAFIDKWVSKVKEFYSDKTISKEGEMVAQLEKFEQLQQLFMEAMQGAGENYLAAEVVDEKSTTQEGDAMYSERNDAKITLGMTDSERAEILKNKVITAPVYAGQAQRSITESKNDLESQKDSLIKSALVKIGEEFGVFTDYSISDVDIDIRLSRGNLKESVSKKINPMHIAKLMPVLKTAVENAVGVECHANRYFFDNDTVMFENLIGGYVDGNSFIPVRFGLKHSVSGKATLYLIVDQEKIDVKKIKAEVAKAPAVQNDRPKTSRSAFNISLASIMPFVNGKDLLRYLPDNMLNNQQREAKYEAMAETVVYTNNKNDQKYTEYIRTGKLSSAKQMVQQAAKAAGYTKMFFHGAKKGGGFTRFREWSYFTENKQYAERYAQRDNPGSLYELYGKTDKPFDTRDEKASEIFEDIRNEYGLSEIQESGLPDWTDGYDITDYISENDLDYDTVILDEGGDLVDGKPVSRGLSYVIRKSNQVKSADVITYDDEGNIIPISHRFNRENEDIRYSLRNEKDAGRKIERLEEKLKTQKQESREKLKSYKAEQKELIKSMQTEQRMIREELTGKESDITLMEKEFIRLAKKYEQMDTRTGKSRIKDAKTIAQLKADLKAEAKAHKEDSKIWEKEFNRLLRDYETSGRQIERLEATIARQRADAKAKITQVRETQEVQKQRKHVEDNAKKLMRILTNPTKDAHAPMALQEPLQKFLNSIDFTSKRYAAGGSATIKDRSYINALAKVRDAIKGQRTALTTEDGVFTLDVPPEFTEEIDKHINMVSDATEGLDLTTNRVYEMTSAELKDLNYILNTINKAIRDIDRMHMQGEKARTSGLARETMQEMQNRKPIKGEKGNWFMWNNYTPFHAFRRYGKAAMKIFDGLKAGQAKLARTINSVVKFTEKTYTAKEVKEWEHNRHEIKLDSGKTVTMSSAQIMTFWCLSHRDQAIPHMQGAGIRMTTLEKFVSKANTQKELVQKDHFSLTLEDVNRINQLLTDRQRTVAREMQQFMQNFGGKLVNEISMARWDFMAATEKDYFPIDTVETSRDVKNPDQKKTSLFALLNKSFTKAPVQNARNAIVIDSIFNVFANHMSEVAEYNAFALPLVDTMKWFNYRENIDTGEGHIHDVGVNRAIRDTLGTEAIQYFVDLMTDINSSQKAGRHEDFFGKILGRSKAASVAWNTRVAIQQISALPRASMILNYKSLIKGASKVRLKYATQEMMKYSGIALWKSMGYYDLNVGKSVERQIKGDTSIVDKFNEVGMWLPGKMDERTWARIWIATKDQVQNTTHLTGEDLLQATAKKFEEVVYETQVVDSVLTKSSFMRDKNLFIKEATSFMAEPTLAINILMSAFQDYEEGHSRSEKVKRGLMIGFTGYALAGVVNALLNSFSDAWRDDDEFEDYWEKYRQALFGEKFIDGNLFSELNPIEKIAFVKDVLSVAKGNEPHSTYSKLMTDAVNLINSYQSIADGKGSKTAYGVVYQTLQYLSTASGVGMSNMTREVIDIWNNTIGKINPEQRILRYKPDNGDELLNAIQKGTPEDIQRVFGRFESQQKAESALQSAIREKYVSGEMTEEEAEELLNTNFDRDDEHEVYWILDEWDYAKENGNTEGYAKYGKFFDAIESGADYEAEMDRLREHGSEDSEIRSGITKKYHKAYMEADETSREEIREKLRPVYEAAGMDADEIDAKFNDWDFEAEYGMTYGEFKGEYRDGNVTENELRGAMKFYGLMQYEIAEEIRSLNDEIKFVDKYDMTLSEMKDAYDNGDISPNQMRSALMFDGMTQKDAKAWVKQRDIEKRLGIDYMEWDDAYKHGDISRQTFYNAMIENGTTHKDADDAILSYDWLKKNVKQYPDLASADGKKFAVRIHAEYAPDETLEDYGVSIDAYLEYKKLRPECKGVDANGDGKTDDGTLRDSVLRMIDSLPISNEAKDGLALMSYSRRSIRKNAPWH